jgi:RND family efflux transporter MFP subunit
MFLSQPEPVKAAAPEAALAVKTQILKSTSVTLEVQSLGTVQPRTRTSLISEVSGAVLEVSEQFIVGGTFGAGDVLLSLDPTDYEVALQRAEAQLISANAKLELEKARAIQASKEWQMTGRPQSEAPILALRKPYLAEAEANILQAKAEVKRAKLKLEKTEIRAPYAGMVASKGADVGQYVTMGSRLGETFAIDFVEVRLPLTERDLARMDALTFKGIPSESTVALSGSVNGTQTTWIAQVVRSEGVVNEINRSQYLVARISDPYGIKDSGASSSSPLLVGTFVTAKLKGKVLEDVFELPRSSLLQGSKVATVDSQTRMNIRAVDVIFSDDSFYYVKGLKDGVQVITSALGTPIEGLKLQLRNSPNSRNEAK